MTNIWNDFQTWITGALGIAGSVVLFLVSGKVLRVNRADRANTNADVAGSNAVETANDSISLSIRHLQSTIDAQAKELHEQGQKLDTQNDLIQTLRSELQELRSEVHNLHSRRSSAIDLLEEIHLCVECDSQFGVILRAAIKTLKDQENGN